MNSTTSDGPRMPHFVSSIVALAVVGWAAFTSTSVAVAASPEPHRPSSASIHRPKVILGGGPQLSINDVAMSEGNSGTIAFLFTVTLAPITSATVTVDFATADGSAKTSNDDYVANSGTLTFPANTSSGTISVLVNGDTTFEGDETFFVNLTNPSNAIIVGGQGKGTINNDDAAPRLTIDDVSHLEGNSGTIPYVFTVGLSNPTDQEITVRFAAADGSAKAADSDYQATSGTLTIAPKTTTATLTVLVNGDTQFEPDETFLVNLSSPINATLEDGTGVGTIRNDDEAAANPNLCHNPSFESNTSGWKRYGGSTIKRVSRGQSGNFSLRVTARGEEDGDDDDHDDDDKGSRRAEFGVNDSPNCVGSTVSSGAHYRFTAWVRSSSSHGHVRIRVREYLGDDRQGTPTLSSAVTLSSTWKKLTVVRIARAAGSTLDLQILDKPVREGEVFQVDNISAVLVTSLADDQDKEEPLGLQTPDFALSLSPNPIKVAGNLRFVTSRPGPVKIELFDVSGRRVRSVVDESFMPGGPHALTIDARRDDGVRLRAGVYFYRLQTVDGAVSRRFSILE